jgi:hypothetical protein
LTAVDLHGGASDCLLVNLEERQQLRHDLLVDAIRVVA